MASIGQYAGIALLNQMFGPAIACVRTTITAASTAVTTINTGSVASAGASGVMDTNPSASSIVLIMTPGTGATQNIYTAPHAFLVTGSSNGSGTATLTIASQSIGLAVTAGDFVFLVGSNTATGVTTAPGMIAYLNTLFIGQTTQAWSTTVTDAQLLAGEPTSVGTYGRVAFLNSATDWPAATTSAEIETVANGAAITYAASTAAYSTTTSPLASWFAGDIVTLDAGHPIWSGANTPATDIVNGAGVTLSYAGSALSAKVQ